MHFDPSVSEMCYQDIFVAKKPVNLSLILRVKMMIAQKIVEKVNCFVCSVTTNSRLFGLGLFFVVVVVFFFRAPKSVNSAEKRKKTLLKSERKSRHVYITMVSLDPTDLSTRTLPVG